MFTDAQDTLTFLTGGNAVVTAKSLKTGDHFTFKAQKPTKETPAGGKVRDHDASVLFIKVLGGSPDSWDSWHFIGTVFLNDNTFRPKVQGKASAAFRWLFAHLSEGRMPPQAELQHEGSCCRCGRTLTHPESIASGIGPECRKHFDV